jgi:hypothetical protein|tara:strand:+ start:51 stop:527 length:477 start_codon:yes stop_codon:yes gene_type:complete
VIITSEIDDWLDKDLNEFLSYKFLYETPHFFQEFSVNPNKKFYSFNFNNDDLIINYLTLKLQKTLQLHLKFNRIYMNIQHPGMSGEFHTDDNDEGGLTCLYMLVGSGDFEIKDEKTFQFKKNKLICFDARKLHMGHEPKKGPRITIAFKTKIIKNEGE